MTETMADRRGLLRSAVAVFLGFLTFAVLSLGAGQLMRALGVYPRWLQLYNLSSNLWALASYSSCAVAGSYIAARCAPRNPIAHALAVGVLWVVLAVRLLIFRINTYDTGPAWYPMALMLAALPCAWLGAALHRRQNV